MLTNKKKEQRKTKLPAHLQQVLPLSRQAERPNAQMNTMTTYSKSSNYKDCSCIHNSNFFPIPLSTYPSIHSAELYAIKSVINELYFDKVLIRLDSLAALLSIKNLDLLAAILSEKV